MSASLLNAATAEIKIREVKLQILKRTPSYREEADGDVRWLDGRKAV